MNWTRTVWVSVGLCGFLLLCAIVATVVVFMEEVEVEEDRMYFVRIYSGDISLMPEDTFEDEEARAWFETVKREAEELGMEYLYLAKLDLELLELFAGWLSIPVQEVGEVAIEFSFDHAVVPREAKNLFFEERQLLAVLIPEIHRADLFEHKVSALEDTSVQVFLRKRTFMENMKSEVLRPYRQIRQKLNPPEDPFKEFIQSSDP